MAPWYCVITYTVLKPERLASIEGLGEERNTHSFDREEAVRG
jgi:hypothetical protein